jgi:hypothetical protein
MDEAAKALVMAALVKNERRLKVVIIKKLKVFIQDLWDE